MIRERSASITRSLWRARCGKGNPVGLVTIPVKLYLATESKGISFNMLHKTDLSRIQMKVWCPVEDEPISRSDTVKGFEYAPGEYVVVTDEDLERVRSRRSARSRSSSSPRPSATTRPSVS